MVNKNNCVWNDPYSSFSQLNMDDAFFKNLLVRIINSFSKPIRTRYDGHESVEFPIVTFFNALVGNSQNTGTTLLNRKLKSIFGIESSSHSEVGRIIPHPSQIRNYSTKFSMEEVNETFSVLSQEILLHLFEQGAIPKQIKMAFDFHKELYYGKEKSPYIHGIKPENGTSKAFIWHTCCLILKGRGLQIGSVMVKRGDDTGAFIKKMIEFLESLGFLIELTAMDKEYYQKDIFKYLDKKEIRYIVPVRESKKLRKMKEAALQDPKRRVQTYAMKDKYVKGKGYTHHKFKAAFYGKKGLNFGILRAQYRKNERPLGEILKDIFVLATNSLITSPSLEKKYHFYKTRKEYGSRWIIETSYRDCNPFLMYTTSKDPNVRNLYFIVSLLLYNLWVLANLLLHKTQYWKAKEPKVFFKEDLKKTLVIALEYFLKSGKWSKTFCRTKEIKTKRCILI